MPVLNVIFSSLGSYPFSASALPTNLEHSAFLSLGRALIRRGVQWPRIRLEYSIASLDAEERLFDPGLFAKNAAHSFGRALPFAMELAEWESL